MKTAMVSELKSKLSAYLAEVRGGASIVVFDRNTPIARLVPYEVESDDLVILEAASPPAALRRIKGIRPKGPIDVDQLLADLRKDEITNHPAAR